MAPPPPSGLGAPAHIIIIIFHHHMHSSVHVRDHHFTFQASRERRRARRQAMHAARRAVLPPLLVCHASWGPWDRSCVCMWLSLATLSGGVANALASSAGWPVHF